MVLISTYWNVNPQLTLSMPLYEVVLISTYWNVNINKKEVNVYHTTF